jgi:hypothetical protein
MPFTQQQTIEDEMGASICISSKFKKLLVSISEKK